MNGLQFRAIDYERDPLAEEAALLVFKGVLADPSKYCGSNPAATYRTMVPLPDFMNYCVTSQSGSLLAVGSVRLHEGGVGSIENVVVAPDSRGNNVGTFLLQHLEDRGKRAGVELMRLSSLPGAVPFYERNGYRKIHAGQPQDLAKWLDGDNRKPS